MAVILPQWYTLVVRIINVTKTSVLFGSFLVVAAIAFVMIIVRRNKQPLRSRTPGLLLLQLVFASVLALMFSVYIYLDDQAPCLLFLAYFTFGLPLLFTPYFLRCWKIFFVFKMQGTSHTMLKQLDDILQTDENSATDSKSFSSLKKWKFHHWYKFLMSNIPLAVIGSIFLIFHLAYFVVMCLIFIFVLKNNNLLLFCQIPIVVLIIVVLTQAALYIFLIGAAAFFLRKVRDEFNISKELYVSMAIISLSFVAVGAVGLAQFWIQDARQRIAALSAITTGILIDALIYGILPVINTYVWERRLKRARQNRKQEAIEDPSFQDLDLRLFIQDPKKFSCIEAYCKSELSVENLYAFREIQQYRQLATDATRAVAKASTIYQTFVSEDAPLQLNVRRVQRLAIRNAIQSGLVPPPAPIASAGDAPAACGGGGDGGDGNGNVGDTQQHQDNSDDQTAQAASHPPTVAGAVDWPRLFDEIEDEILHTMSDTLMRFQSSTSYKKLLQHQTTRDTPL